MVFTSKAVTSIIKSNFQNITNYLRFSFRLISFSSKFQVYFLQRKTIQLVLRVFSKCACWSVCLYYIVGRNKPLMYLSVRYKKQIEASVLICEISTAMRITWKNKHNTDRIETKCIESRKEKYKYISKTQQVPCNYLITLGLKSNFLPQKNRGIH